MATGEQSPLNTKIGGIYRPINIQNLIPLQQIQPQQMIPQQMIPQQMIPQQIQPQQMIPQQMIPNFTHSFIDKINNPNNILRIPNFTRPTVIMSIPNQK
jgi:hypothetical protein